MEHWQKLTIAIYGVVACLGFLQGYMQCKEKKNPYGLARIYNFIGAFVWADALIFGFFWTLLCLVILFFNSWYLFLLALSLFWVVRSIGEILYWMHEQFSSKSKNPPERFLLTKLLHGESVWIGYQIIWQCILVISLLFSLLFAKLWLSDF